MTQEDFIKLPAQVSKHDEKSEDLGLDESAEIQQTYMKFYKPNFKSILSNYTPYINEEGEEEIRLEQINGIQFAVQMTEEEFLNAIADA